MSFSPSAFGCARGRSTAAWASAALALVLLTGCSATPGGAASAEGSSAVSAAATSTPAETPSATAEETVAPAASSEALSALGGLKVAARGTMSDYDREGLFGGWIDADGDCEDTRQEILARDLDDVVSTDGCTVETGVLDTDPYTATTINFVRGPATSSDVQIDHVVSLGNAWITGARNLTQQERVEFANDPLNLLAVDGPTNQSKSDKPADEWLPPNVDFRCEFVAIQIAVKAKYELWVTAPEKTTMTEVLADCQGQEVPTGAVFGDIDGNAPVEEAPALAPVQEVPAPEPAPVAPAPVDPEPVAPAPVAPEPAPVPAAPAAPAAGFANCSAAKAAGAAPLYAGSPGYAPKLDRDGDGVACES